MADYIERQAALRAVNEFFHDPKVDIALNAVPAENVREDVQARWEPGNPICPVCGENKFKGLDADIWADWQPTFCPNCGARMDGGGER